MNQPLTALRSLVMLFCAAAPITATRAANVVSLDGTWLLATDPDNVGRDQGWPGKPAANAKPARVPWIIQDTFPDYHGVAWYWREATPPANPYKGGRYLLRFWQVDYLAEVWVNGVHVGRHEGSGEPFVLDATEVVKPQAVNRIAVRVLNPTNQPIDGITLAETTRWAKNIPYTPGLVTDFGGITDSVELIVVPVVRVEDAFVRPNAKTGQIRIQANLRNAGQQPAAGRLDCTVSPATHGATLNAVRLTRELPPGDTLIDTELKVDAPRLWELNDPYLYRVTVRVTIDSTGHFDEYSTRCGFRDFHFADGCFRLNGRRIFLKGTQTDTRSPGGIVVAHDPDLPRRDLFNCKTIGMNMIRSFCGQVTRAQLDLCDEIGLMVYQENPAAWRMEPSPRLAERFTRTIQAMVKRDRNHPCVVMWGMLNETPKGPVFEQAVASLPVLRALDDTRVVMLNSGNWHTQGSAPAGLELWQPADRDLPSVARNSTGHVIRAGGESWLAGQMSFHPGPQGQYAVVRWTAPADETVDVSAAFAAVHELATTDVHVQHNGKALFDGAINARNKQDQARFQQSVSVRKGDTIDCACGYGNKDYGADATGLSLVIRSPGGKVCDAATDYSATTNPTGPWSYGQLDSGPTPRSHTFKPFTRNLRTQPQGSLSNPGTQTWQDVLNDLHPYQPLPHNATVIRTLRTIDGGQPDKPVFITEYGIGSAVDLARVTRHFEQWGNTKCEDAVIYRKMLDQFSADWQRWNMGEAFADPEDYFRQCVAWMAPLRKLGTNAIRANPKMIGQNITGLVDPCITGEGLIANQFRELKPGVIDAMFDAFSPLRWCLFVEPVQVYRGRKAKFEAILANEDTLAPGEYPVRIQVVGPRNLLVFNRTIVAKIPDPKGKPEPSFALPVFAEDVPIDGPSGRYRFMVTFCKGAAAAGGEVEFYVADPADMPKVNTEVVLWGDDAGLAKWLDSAGIKARPFAPDPQGPTRVILVGNRAADGAEAFGQLARQIARGSRAVFLCPEVFKKDKDAAAWLPLANKPTLATLNVWLYHKDDWAKSHPIFDGLPAGCVLDHTFYREVISSRAWSSPTEPIEAVAGAVDTSLGYASGLTVAVHNLGAGQCTLNTLRIRENLGTDPVAERLLRNMLRHAGRDPARPPTALPADFDAQLKAMGYGSASR